MDLICNCILWPSDDLEIEWPRNAVLYVFSHPGALRRWTAAGPEITRMVKEFEDSSLRKQVTKDTENRHHEPAVQEAFLNDVRSLTKVIEELGNPFREESQDLLVLDNKEITDA